MALIGGGVGGGGDTMLVNAEYERGPDTRRGERDTDGVGCVTPSSVQGSCKPRLRGAERATPPLSPLHRRQE